MVTCVQSVGLSRSQDWPVSGSQRAESNAAAAAIARVLDEASDRFGRCRVLPAYVEIMLATHEVAVARKAADGVFKIAEELEAPFLRAGAAYAQGAVSLAEGDPAEP